MAYQAPFMRSAYNYDRDQASTQTGLACDPAEDMTQQQFKEEADINEIVRRFGITGQLPEDFKAPMVGDFTGISDFQTALNAVHQARDEFMRLPGETRARFNNNPQQLLEFVADAGNREEAIKLGLVPKPPENAPAGAPGASAGASDGTKT